MNARWTMTMKKKGRLSPNRLPILSCKDLVCKDASLILSDPIVP